MGYMIIKEELQIEQWELWRQLVTIVEGAWPFENITMFCVNGRWQGRAQRVRTMSEMKLPVLLLGIGYHRGKSLFRMIWMRSRCEAPDSDQKSILRKLSGMEPNIIRTTVSAGVMLSFISHSRVMPRVP